jgi:hypothetical protein
VDFIGQRCLKTLKGMLPHALNAKEPETYLNGILCPWITIYKLIYSMFGGLILWGLSKIHMDMSTF